MLSTVYIVEMLRSYLRASPSGAQAHRIHICYCINCMYCIYSTVYILTWYELRFINDLARKRTVCTYTVYTVYILYIYMADVLFTKLRWVFPKMPQDALKTSLICFQNAANHSKFSSLRKSKVYVHDTTLRSQNAEQLRENGWLRCSRKPQSFKTYDSSEFWVWSSYKGSVLENVRKVLKDSSWHVACFMDACTWFYYVSQNNPLTYSGRTEIENDDNETKSNRLCMNSFWQPLIVRKTIHWHTQVEQK